MAGDVLIGYLHPNDVSASFHRSLLNLVGFDMAHDRRLSGWAQVKCSSGGIPEGRNQLAGQLLAGDCEWLFMVDADMGFEPMALEQLLHVADQDTRPIVGGLCFALRENSDDGMGGFRTVPRPTIFDWVQHEDGHMRFTGRHHYPVNALVECAATGGAFLLIHRSVLQRIRDKFGDVWFNRVVGTDGSVIGEDISFFTRTAALEIPCHVHTGIRTTHLKSSWVGEETFWNSFSAPPATEKIDVIVPVLHRPQNVRRLMQSLRASTGLARAMFVTERGDIVQQAEILKYGGEWIEHSGSFAAKVNAAYRATKNPWLLLVGDDVSFLPGWLDHVQDVARRYGGDVIGTNDCANPRVVRGEHATHPAIRRSYVDTVGASWDGPGVVCHEGYRHWFVDDEIVTAAKQRRTFFPAVAACVQHHHPLFGTAPVDDVYEAGAKHQQADKALFEQRLSEHGEVRV